MVQIYKPCMNIFFADDCPSPTSFHERSYRNNIDTGWKNINIGGIRSFRISNERIQMKWKFMFPQAKNPFIDHTGPLYFSGTKERQVPNSNEVSTFSPFGPQLRQHNPLPNPLMTDNVSYKNIPEENDTRLDRWKKQQSKQLNALKEPYWNEGIQELIGENNSALFEIRNYMDPENEEPEPFALLCIPNKYGGCVGLRDNYDVEVPEHYKSQISVSSPTSDAPYCYMCMNCSANMQLIVKLQILENSIDVKFGIQMRSY